MQNKQILKLLIPSWVTNFIGIAGGVLLTLAAVTVSQYQGSDLQQQIFAYQSGRPAQTTGGAYANVTNNIANNSFLGSLPLLLTWAAIGLVVYYFSISIAKSFGRAADLRDELGYVHASRRSLIRETLVHLCVRVFAVVIWFVFIKLTISVFVPYALAAGSIAGQTLKLSSVIYAVLGIAVIYGAVYINNVLLRLIVLRPRIFH